MSSLQRVSPPISFRTVLRLYVPLARSPFFKTFIRAFLRTLPETLAQGLCVLVTWWLYQGAAWAKRALQDWISVRPLARKLLDVANAILQTARTKWELIKANAETVSDLDNVLPELGLERPGWFDLRITALTTDCEGYYQEYERISGNSESLVVKRKEFLVLIGSLESFKTSCSKFSKTVSRTTVRLGEKLVHFRRQDMLERYGTISVIPQEEETLPPFKTTTTAILLELLLAMGPVRFLRRNILRIE